MRQKTYCLSFLICLLFTLFSFYYAYGDDKNDKNHTQVSPQTKTCIACHNTYTPGIVEDWLTSRHSKITPAEALRKPSLERRISAEGMQRTLLEKELLQYNVGCFECHSQNPNNHKDTFDHFGFNIHYIVSPNDCMTCHPEEVTQFSQSKKSYAYRNLIENPVYSTLVDTVTGLKKIEKGEIVSQKPTESTLHETCLGCHGTRIEVKGFKTVSTKLGQLSFPDLTNWPNQGVGRVNPDGSRGACTSCHPRHSFSIEIARKPYNCAQCHLEPDVPAWNVYDESKHGNIFFSKQYEWDLNSVPWTVGKDFKAPTCAACHNSLIVSPIGNVLIERTHDFGSRLWVRLFGLIYSHPQPKSGDTTIIKNKDNLPLPTTFSGELASIYLIDASEQEKRISSMKGLCNGCHSTDWTNGHFAKLENTLKETNEMITTATALMGEAWGKGIEDKTNPFDESIEQMWVKQWLFYSNSIRYASAMSGAPDYAAFKNGWWYLNENVQHMKDWIELKKKRGGIKIK